MLVPAVFAVLMKMNWYLLDRSLKLPNDVNRFVLRNGRRSSYSLWRYVKNPRENCGKYETEREKHDDRFHHAGRRIERRQKNRCGLDQQPRDKSICNCDFVNLS